MKKTSPNVIRVETALSRFPLHRLTKKTSAVEIVIRDQNDEGELLRWEISHNSKYGQPGPLAYKLDTLIINRRIEIVGRPTPKLIKLGTLVNIAHELGLADSGKNKADIKRALYQNAFAAITAKVAYRAVDGTKRTIEFGTTRYAVVMTGETLPDGRRADAVYVVLHDLYREVLDTAITRPLDYEYLRSLSPAPQRLYELLSYQVYAALRNGAATARLRYSEFCRYAPLTRYLDHKHMKKQMHKLHAPHRRSGYIAAVAFEATTDRAGQADWMMVYTPGPKAAAEYQAFTRRLGGAEAGAGAGMIALTPAPGPEAVPSGLEAELVDLGVSAAQAAELAREFPADQVRAQIENLARQRKKVKDPGAWLASAIRRGYVMKAVPVAPRTTPAVKVVSAADRAERERKQALGTYWMNLTAEERDRVNAAALAAAPADERAAFAAETDPRLRRLKMTPIRDAYLAKVILGEM